MLGQILLLPTGVGNITTISYHETPLEQVIYCVYKAYFICPVQSQNKKFSLKNEFQRAFYTPKNANIFFFTLQEILSVQQTGRIVMIECFCLSFGQSGGYPRRSATGYVIKFLKSGVFKNTCADARAITALTDDVGRRRRIDPFEIERKFIERNI